jgi:glycosyltransferase involved in cell wall biosynthesis
MKISVAVITYNNEKYIRPQLDTILENIGPDDEVVVSDDHSADGTWSILQEYAAKDPRFHIYQIVHAGCNGNFENALSHCTGDLIFLSDGDNVWEPQKVETVKNAFESNPKVWMVMHDCSVVTGDLQPIAPSVYATRHSKPGVFRNIMKTAYVGSCIAFKKELLKRILPFPKKMPIFYDEWIGLEATKHGKVIFIPNILLKWRRFPGSASTQFITQDGQVTTHKKNPRKGTFKRNWFRIWTRVRKLGWALFR